MQCGVGKVEYYCLRVPEVLDKLNVKKESGLSNKAANDRANKYGKNILSAKKPKSFIRKFMAQFSDFMVVILLIAALVSFVTSAIEENTDYVDSIIILLIVGLNAFIGVMQEDKAEKAIEALKKMSSPKAWVVRGGKRKRIPCEDIVPGDILTLCTGDLVPADARLIESNDLTIDESSLTGESIYAAKDSKIIYKDATPLAERKNMVFSASTVATGNALAVVVETGMSTEVGKIAHMLNKEESPQTPLQQKLEQTGKYLGVGALVVCSLIFALGLMQDIPPMEMFMISISLAVAAIPEGLPAVVTIVLAMGVRRMAANRAIIRKLPAVETLGSASVICSDKTGTLTQNKMTVTAVSNGTSAVNLSSEEGVHILTLGALCNNASISGSGGDFRVVGSPTESALLLAAAKVGKIKSELDKVFNRVHEVPFDCTRKLMTTIHRLPSGQYRVITKGAPDVLLECCVRFEGAPLNDAKKQSIRNQNEAMASNALRVIAISYKDLDCMPKSAKEMESGLKFVGLVGMIDPPRPQAKQAVKECRAAGIKPVMITGDHITTAKAIAKELHMLAPNDKAMTGAELEKMPQSDLEKVIYQYAVFARVSPEHKVRIVKAFQKRGAVVVMTGDGVNDAPALKAADIGCAMGITGTEVAKGAADMIMTDDNFSTIVQAVRQGRGIFQNIKKTVHFLLSSNIGEIITVLTAFLLRIPTPLLAIQLLWVNLVTDSLPALALGVEPVDDKIMKKPPIKPGTGLFTRESWRRIALEGCFIGGISILAFTIGRVFYDTSVVPIIGRTMAFAVLSLSQLVHAFNVRSEHSIIRSRLFSNMKMIYSFLICVILQVSVISMTSLSAIFKTVPLPDSAWIIVVLLSLSPLAVVEAEKFLTKIDDSRAGESP